jgi:hypothetical protein
MLRRLFLTLALALLFSALPAPAAACTCVGPNPTCQAVWTTPDIFVGQVLAIESPADAQPFLRRRVRIRSTEVFRGGVSGEVDVWTGLGGGDCGYDFKVGETYLVYAYRDATTNRISTGICSNTQKLATAGADLAYLRSLPTNTARFGKIIGTATRFEPVGDATVRQPFSGARVIVEGGGRQYEVRSGGDGTYEIAVPPGTYDLRVEVPDGLYALSSTRVTVADVRGCASTFVVVRSDGRITGRLVTAGREPVPYFPLELLPLGDFDREYFYPSIQVRTDARGLFEFTRIPPGAYYVGYDLRRDRGADVIGPRVLLAGSDGGTRAAQVAPGGRVNLEDHSLPSGVTLVRVSGTVTEPGGGFAAGVRVYVRMSGGDSASVGPAVVTERDGRFTVTVVAGRTYQLFADGYDADRRYVSRAEGPAFTAGADASDVVLALRPNR